MLDLRPQYASIREEVQAAIDSVLDSQQFILGPQVQALEREIARYCGARYAVGVASGTDALILALAASGIGPGDQVLVPPFSFIATADSVSLLGATPVFVDIQPDTFNLDPARLAARLTPRTRAIIPVHLYGQPADMDPILAIARQHNLKVIEDCAQALGSTYRGRKAATLGDLGCLSFFPSKNLGGCGDGGMIVSDSEEMDRRLRALRNHGCVRKYVSQEQGWNSRLDELQAAILRVKLRHLDTWNAQRRAHAARYHNLLLAVPGVATPKVPPGHVFHQYTIRVPRRDRVQQFLAEQGVASTVYYPVPIHLQPVYASLGHGQGDFPESERASAEVLSLPIYPELTTDQINYVAETVGMAARQWGASA